MRPLVDPPIACSTTCAFRNDDAVKNSLGRGPFALASAAATLPLASADRKRSACGAGIVDPQRHVFDGFEHHGAAGMLQQFGARRRMLDHGAARGEIAVEDGKRAFRLDRI